MRHPITLRNNHITGCWGCFPVFSTVTASLGRDSSSPKDRTESPTTKIPFHYIMLVVHRTGRRMPTALLNCLGVKPRDTPPTRPVDNRRSGEGELPMRLLGYMRNHSAPVLFSVLTRAATAVGNRYYRGRLPEVNPDMPVAPWVVLTAGI